MTTKRALHVSPLPSRRMLHDASGSPLGPCPWPPDEEVGHVLVNLDTLSRLELRALLAATSLRVDGAEVASVRHLGSGLFYRGLPRALSEAAQRRRAA